MCLSRAAVITPRLMVASNHMNRQQHAARVLIAIANAQRDAAAIAQAQREVAEYDADMATAERDAALAERDAALAQRELAETHGRLATVQRAVVVAQLDQVQRIGDLRHQLIQCLQQNACKRWMNRKEIRSLQKEIALVEAEFQTLRGEIRTFNATAVPVAQVTA
jgi:hypothetical protein